MDMFKEIKTILACHLDSGYWAKTCIFGITESSSCMKEEKTESGTSTSTLSIPKGPIFFNSDQAKELWLTVEKLVSEEQRYQFLHAIAPSLLLVRVMQYSNGPWRCYHEVKTKQQVMHQWVNKWEWLYNCTTFTLCSCAICLEDIISNGSWVSCKYCHQKTHVTCKEKYLASASIRACEYCRTNYSNEDDIEYHKCVPAF